MTLDELKERTLQFLGIRQQSYKQAFGSPAGQQVLEDLAKFCRANRTVWHPDARMHAVLTGRQEVWLRIQQHLNLPAETLFTLYSGGLNLDNGDDNA